MTDYDYYNLPDADDMALKNELPDELLPAGRAAVLEALESGEVKVEAIKAAYVFDRKGYLYTEGLDIAKRNASYSSDDDDIVLQLTIRIPNPKHHPELSKVAELEEAVRTHTREAAKAFLLEQIAAEEAAAERAATAAAKRRAELAELTGE